MKPNKNRLYLAPLTLLGAAILATVYSPVKAEQPTPESDLEAGIAAYHNYDFEGARRHLAAFSKQRKKASEESIEEFEQYQRRLNNAEGFLERIEKITIIDSIAVDADSFFSAYRLPVSEGALLPPDSIPFQEGRGDATMAFTNENRDFMMWAQRDSTGYTRIAESSLLTDGKWSLPTLAPEELSEGGDADFPFMMADGTTLYYASDGDESIGGLDIFVASRDAATGEYMQPQNIGMPYNSPFDDYMLAIDELNGIGWWATDRNQLEGQVTIYVFLVNDMRKNIDTEMYDDAELADFARIASFKNSQSDYEEREKIEEARAIIRNIGREKTSKKIDFRFPASGGKVYYSFDELPDENSRSKMRAYLKQLDAEQALNDRIADARRKYHAAPSKAAGNQIALLENDLQAMTIKTKEMRNEVYKALGSR